MNAPDRGRSAPGFSKIRPTHLERQALVYVRQSTPRQVLSNRESTELQYNLRNRAVDFGWHSDRILVIDDDLGQSGASASDRAGFQRLLTEVSLNHVGLILGSEMSRLARSCKDWYQLLELCALFGVLLADQDGLYDPTQYNDRLLLGLKGTMSEAELHLLKTRMDYGRRNKAERGELFGSMPIGYLRSDTSVTLDPDEQVQSVIRLVFSKFTELGSCRCLLRYFRQHEILLPVRPCGGDHRGQLQWKRATNEALYSILRNPTYAGVYTYGRSCMDPRRKKPNRPGSGRVLVPMEQWPIVIQDALPAYISWEQFLANRERLQQNRARFECRGMARGGAALLTGLIVCGRCGWRMFSHYNHTECPRYECPHLDQLRADQPCPSIGARFVDRVVSEQVLRALEPAAVALSLQTLQDLTRERECLEEQWQQRIERARYAANHAKRQYDAVDPENRLVARELERRWEQCLRELRGVEEEWDRFQAEPPFTLTKEDRARIESLAADIPSLWEASTTTKADRQEIVRRLVERVVVLIEGKTEVVKVAIHWAGGHVTEHETKRSVRRFENLRDYEQLQNRLKELRQEGLSVHIIAEKLNVEGFRSPQGKGHFSKANVRQLLSRWGLCGATGKHKVREQFRKSQEWWVDELVKKLGIPLSTLCQWCRKGWVHARKVAWPGGRWLIWADEDELARLCRLKRCSRRGGPEYPAELTTPKERPNA